MTNKKIRVLCLLTLIGFNTSLHASSTGYYRWTDESGNTKLSDRPPGGDIKAEFVTTGTKRSLSSEQSAQGKSQPTTASTTDTKKTAEKKPELPTQMEVLPEKDPAACKQAQANMAALSGKTRIRMTDADGTKRFINTDERDVQIARAKKSIEMNCGK